MIGIKKRKKGMTLIEMLIAISILVIGLGGFAALAGRAWRTNSYSMEMGQSAMAVSQGVGKMVNYIRGARQADNGAYPVKSAGDNDLVLYSDFDKDGITERLHFYKSGQNILMGVTDPTNTMPRTYASGDQSVITIAQHIVNNSSTPIFYYYDKEFGGDEAVHPPLTTPVDVSNIRLVKIHLAINIILERDPDNIEMESFVEMRNLNDYDRIH